MDEKLQGFFMSNQEEVKGEKIVQKEVSLHLFGKSKIWAPLNMKNWYLVYR